MIKKINVILRCRPKNNILEQVVDINLALGRTTWPFEMQSSHGDKPGEGKFRLMSGKN